MHLKHITNGVKLQQCAENVMTDDIIAVMIGEKRSFKFFGR